jgi:hypothetical protein
MKQLVKTTLWMTLCIGISAVVQADDFCSLLLAGKLAEAKKQFPEQAEEPQMAKLFIELGNKDAAKSIDNLTNLQNSSKTPLSCANVIANRLAGYTFLDGRLGTSNMGKIRLAQSGPEYAQYDDFTKRMLLVTSSPATDKPAAATKPYEELTKVVSADDSLWLMLDKAQVLIDLKKEKDAAKILRSISNRDNGEQVPAALYVQIKAAFQSGKSDEALRLLGIMQEAYPYAIGLDALSATLVSEADESVEAEPEAEKLTKTVYSVQIGVFSSKANAQTVVKTLDSYKQKIEIMPRSISGKEYFVVYAGRFNRYDDATAFKEKLESARKERYQVIAR